ncbi:hypothetical protein [Streptomyces sp. NBC_01304]|uniref:hypothetical protein n=1 Tax=Streptomyces sp. NBC_01304 TaxID=2903818 RepID=UPI002E1026ED|nr:hypothetical protein OG430_16370 [Streptomyces sp. NBC_01304]
MSGEDSEELQEARQLLNADWRTGTGPSTILEGARRLVALGPQHFYEVSNRLGFVFGDNGRLGADSRIEAAHILASLGGMDVRRAAAALRSVMLEYRGYVEESDNIDGAYALAKLAPEYVSEASWWLRHSVTDHREVVTPGDRIYALHRLAGLRGPGVHPQLPQERVDFPVYGITQGVEERWPEAWGTIQRRGEQPLGHVSHGHRMRESGATLVISTWRSTGSHIGKHTPAEALTHARVDSLAGALNLAFPHLDRTAKQWEIEADFHSTAAAFLPLGRRHGQTLGISVDGEPVPFEILRVGHVWAATTSLGPLAIGAYGLGTDLHEHELKRRTG